MPDTIEEAQKRLERMREAKTALVHAAPAPVDALAGFAPRLFSKLIRDMGSKSSDVVLGARFAIAEHVRRNLHRHKKYSIPSTPVTMPDEDELLGLLAKKRRTKEERATISLFAVWRHAAEVNEQKNLANLRTLFETVATFRELDLPEYAGEVLAHLEHQFDVEAVPDDRCAWVMVTRKYAFDFEKLTSALRANEHEEPFYEVVHPEDDDFALRADVEIPAPGSCPDDQFDLPDFP